MCVFLGVSVRFRGPAVKMLPGNYMEEASMLRSHNQNQQTNRALVQTHFVCVFFYFMNLNSVV